jgi:predicted rRNA methylase YqxC with S4 and FtsJ domains
MARRHHRRFVRLVDRLGVESVREAVAVIVAGRVTVNGLIVTNPDARIAANAVVALVPQRVLRGTVKLQAALVQFGAKVSGPALVPEAVEVICLDLSYLALADVVPQLVSLSVSEKAHLIALVNRPSSCTDLP